MASDSSESPLVLTPESTGTGVLDTPAKKARRQTAFYPNMNAANKPQKPFSRSAAKRESVMALGSIEHLQHYFTKTGLSAKKNPLDKPHHGLVPAIGGMGHVPTSPSITSMADIMPMPPSPAFPSPPRPTFSPHVKTYEVDPETLLPGVIEDLVAVSHAWKLDRGRASDLDVPFDVLEVLKITTRAIRSTRNYLLSLPDESTGTIRAQFRPKSLRPTLPTSSSSESTTAAAATAANVSEPITLIRRSALEVLTVLRQLEDTCRLPLSDDAYDAQSDGGHSRGAGTSSSPSNGTLDLPTDTHEARGHRLSDAAIDPDASIAFSLVQVQGRYESVPVWEDEEDSFALEQEESEKEKRDGWDERLVLGSGWLYKQDVKLGDLCKERTVVSAYLDIVDEVLFEGGRAGEDASERGWDRKRRQREGRASSRAAKRRVSAAAADSELSRSMSLGLPGSPMSDGAGARRRISTGMVNIMQGMSLSEEPEGEEMDDIKEEAEEDEEDDEVDDEDLPEWAKRSNFIDDTLGRLHAMMAYFLPSHLLPSLGPPNSRERLLQSLSSGQLLCVAYNICVRKSKKPWGFVSKDGIHDILALEAAAKQNGTSDEDGSGKKVWTFRKTDNLRLWAGALKLRYLLPIQTPIQPISKHPGAPNGSTPLSSPSAAMQKFQLNKAEREPPILFDAKVVAKKDEGWDMMLEGVLYRWLDKVVEERRVHQ